MSTGHPTMLELRNVGFTYSTRTGFGRHRLTRALDDVSFDLRSGETLGVIGRNGCGKSTLMKLLAGIYRPENGAIRRNCRSVSLLSLSVGFDPNLPGSSNLLLACMFLGYSRRQALAKYDEIVAFSELGDFIDQPVKTYSAGMKARLGFSVGITMQADVLLVDEVLGVGDESFSRKATRAMRQRIKGDQSVVLVSHSMGKVRELCDRVVWLEDGQVRREGDPEPVVEEYLAWMESASGVGNQKRREHLGKRGHRSG